MFLFISSSTVDLYVKSVFDKSQMFRYQFERCFFAHLHAKGSNGGALCLTSGQELSIEMNNSVFFNCSVLEGYNGGGIYFYSPNHGNFSFIKVCAIECISKGFTTGFNGHSQFIFAQVHNYGFIDLQYVSVAKCCPTILLTRWAGSTLYYGCHLISNTNFSNNKVEWHSAFVSRESTFLHADFITTARNSAITYGCLQLYNVGESSISQMNFVNNSQSSSQFGLLFSLSPSSLIKDSVFSGNIISGSSLFNGGSGTLRIISCYIDSYSYKSTSPTVISPLSLTPTFSIVHYDTFLCFAEIPCSFDLTINLVMNNRIPFIMLLQYITI